MSTSTETNESGPRLRLDLSYSKVNFMVVWLGGTLLELCGWFSYAVSYFLFLIAAEILYRQFAIVANELLFSVGLLLLLFVASTLVVFGTQIRRIAKRHRVDPHRNLIKDSRPPILYLRPFNDDYIENLGTFRWQTGEKLLIDALKDVGPGIALARHGRELSLLGANRIRVNDSDWQQTVRYLMSIAPLVIIQADISESLIWDDDSQARSPSGKGLDLLH